MLNNGQVENRTLFCMDNLEVLRGMDSGVVDLIYLDPPFNKNKVFTAQVGSAAEGATFRDSFREEDLQDEWLNELEEGFPSVYGFLTMVRGLGGACKRPKNHTLHKHVYLTAMAVRLVEMHRVLKPTGSLYLHCDPTMSHYLKVLMDIVFGEGNFMNEIIWRRGRVLKHRPRAHLPRNHDVILSYAKEIGLQRIVEWQYRTYAQSTKKLYGQSDSKGRYRLQELRTYGKETIDKFRTEDRIVLLPNGKGMLKQYLEEKPGVTIDSVWEDIKSLEGDRREFLGYPTQKPTKLVERIVRASCPKDGVVLDPFCGCGTTCVAAERLGRKWIGIDTSPKTYELLKVRFRKEFVGSNEQPSEPNAVEKLHLQTTPPKRTDMQAKHGRMKPC